MFDSKDTSIKRKYTTMSEILHPIVHFIDVGSKLMRISLPIIEVEIFRQDLAKEHPTDIILHYIKYIMYTVL